MTLSEWARKHGVGYEALRELSAEVFGLEASLSIPDDEDKRAESYVQSTVRLEATKKGGRLWRNNVGAGFNEDGQFLRWGLCNDSAKINEVIKSSDLIGIRPILVGPHHIGLTIGQFTARECKRADWKFPKTPSKREQAQLNFIKMINALGGDARFCTDNTTL